VNEIVRHRIVDAAGLLGKDRTPWGTIRPGLRSGSSPNGPDSGEDLYRMNHPAFSNRAPSQPVASRPSLCECADVRAWLGPRRTGRRTLR
jgi:hypothetical protein